MKPGSIVVVDNLSAHKVAGIRECLENAGMFLLYLPPYSPDFNPIEQACPTIPQIISCCALQTESVAPTHRTPVLRRHL